MAKAWVRKAKEMILLDTLKRLEDLVAAGKTTDVQQAIFSVQREVFEMLEERRRLQEDNERLTATVKELKEKMRLKDTANFNDEYQAYFVGGDGPYCPNCFDDKHKLIRMLSVDWEILCKTCGLRLPDPHDRPPGPQAV